MGSHPVVRTAIQRVAALIALATLTIIAVPVSRADASLTLAEAQRLAVERSRMLAGQDSAVAASREMAVAAGQLADPILKLGIDNLPVDTSDRFSLTRDFMTMRQIGLMQEITRSDKRQARADRFEREAEKTLAERQATIAAIQRNTALAWLDRYYAEAMAAVVAEQSREAHAEIEGAEDAYRAGRGNLVNVLAARASLVGLDDRASEIRRKVRAARIVLARWIGNSADAPLAGKPAMDAIRLDPSTLETDIVHHPELAVLAKKEDVAAAEVRVAQANKKPDWSVEVTYSQRGPAYSNLISVGVSVPLQWDQRNRQDREIAARLAVLDQARAEREDLVQSHTAEVRAMIAEWENNRERQTRYERELLPLAAERTQAALGAYRGAKAAITDVLIARRSEIDIRMQALQLEMDTARLWVQLNFLFPEGDAATHTGVNRTKEPR